MWLARELLAEVYAAVDRAHAKRRLTVFFQHAANADIPELTRLARTVDLATGPSVDQRCNVGLKLATSDDRPEALIHDRDDALVRCGCAAGSSCPGDGAVGERELSS